MHVNWYEGYHQQYGDSADQEIQKLKISCRPKDHAVDMVSNLNKVVLLMNNEEETALAFVAWNYFSLQVQEVKIGKQEEQPRKEQNYENLKKWYMKIFDILDFHIFFFLNYS